MHRTELKEKSFSLHLKKSMTHNNNLLCHIHLTDVIVDRLATRSEDI